MTTNLKRRAKLVRKAAILKIFLTNIATTNKTKNTST
jgi:hypothetical protein